MTLRRPLLLALCLLLPSLTPAVGQPLGDPAADRAKALDLDFAAGAEAVTVIDGDTLTLADGRDIRLVGIQAPKLALRRAGFQPCPLAEEAKARLAALHHGRSLGLVFGRRRGDRHGTQAKSRVGRRG